MQLGSLRRRSHAVNRCDLPLGPMTATSVAKPSFQGEHMKVTRFLCLAAVALAVGACERSGDRITGAPPLSAAASANQNIGINVLLSGPPTAAQLAELNTYGNVHGRIIEINAVFMRASEDQLTAIRSLSYVLAANPDAERKGAPVDAVSVTNFAR